MKYYTFVIKQTDEGKLTFRGTCKGFNSFEIIGFLERKKQDIMQQITGEIKPDFVRKVHEGENK